MTLTVAQTCMTSNFYDVAADYPKFRLEDAVRSMLGPAGFPRTKNRKQFERECKKAFDLARKE